MTDILSLNIYYIYIYIYIYPGKNMLSKLGIINYFSENLDSYLQNSDALSTILERIHNKTFHVIWNTDSMHYQIAKMCGRVF